MIKEKDIKQAYKYIKEDDDNFFNDLEIEFHDPFNENEFKLYGVSNPKNIKTFFRFTPEESASIGNISPDVQYLSTHSAGVSLHFRTDSRFISVRCLSTDVPSMKNMEAMAQCGFDIYYRDEKTNQYRYHNTTFQNYIDVKKFLANLGLFREKKERDIIINFPLYSGVVALEIGLEKGSKCIPTKVKNPKKIVCYGTSILQGGSVSRPGLNITNVISRVLDQEVLNYGFSGAGKLEPEIGKIIASREDLDLLIVDAEANAGCDRWMVDNLEKFLDEFYTRYPNLPVVIMNKTQMSIDEYIPRNEYMKIFNDKFLKDIVKKYRRKGKNMIFIDNYHLFDNHFYNDSEYTVDGVHPNDLGMCELVKSYLKAIEEIRKIEKEGNIPSLE